MTEETVKRRISLDIDDDEVEMPAPQAEKTSQQAIAEKARAERAKSISVGATKKSSAPRSDAPKWKANEETIGSLRAREDWELVHLAREQGLSEIDATDNRVMQWTGSRTDKQKGQPVERSKIRCAIVDYLEFRKAENGRGVEVGGKVVDHAATAAVIHAYMRLGGREIHGGSYDSGYLGSKRGENTNRGMIARGFLVNLGEGALPVRPTDEQMPEGSTETVVEPETTEAEIDSGLLGPDPVLDEVDVVDADTDEEVPEGEEVSDIVEILDGNNETKLVDTDPSN